MNAPKTGCGRRSYRYLNSCCSRQQTVQTTPVRTMGSLETSDEVFRRRFRAASSIASAATRNAAPTRVDLMLQTTATPSARVEVGSKDTDGPTTDLEGASGRGCREYRRGESSDTTPAPCGLIEASALSGERQCRPAHCPREVVSGVRDLPSMERTASPAAGMAVGRRCSYTPAATVQLDVRLDTFAAASSTTVVSQEHISVRRRAASARGDHLASRCSPTAPVRATSARIGRRSDGLDPVGEERRDFLPAGSAGAAESAQEQELASLGEVSARLDAASKAIDAVEVGVRSASNSLDSLLNLLRSRPTVVRRSRPTLSTGPVQNVRGPEQGFHSRAAAHSPAMMTPPCGGDGRHAGADWTDMRSDYRAPSLDGRCHRLRPRLVRSRPPASAPMSDGRGLMNSTTSIDAPTTASVRGDPVPGSEARMSWVGGTERAGNVVFHRGLRRRARSRSSAGPDTLDVTVAASSNAAETANPRGGLNVFASTETNAHSESSSPDVGSTAVHIDDSDDHSPSLFNATSPGVARRRPQDVLFGSPSTHVRSAVPHAGDGVTVARLHLVGSRDQDGRRAAQLEAAMNGIDEERDRLMLEIARLRGQQNQSLIHLLHLQREQSAVRQRQVATLADIINSFGRTVEAAGALPYGEDSSLGRLSGDVVSTLRRMLRLLSATTPTASGASDATALPTSSMSLDPAPVTTSLTAAESPSVLSAAARRAGGAGGVNHSSSQARAGRIAVRPTEDLTQDVIDAALRALPRLAAAASAISGARRLQGLLESSGGALAAHSDVSDEPLGIGRCSPETIAALPGVQALMGGDESVKGCVICLTDESTAGQLLCHLPCHHIFHRSCVAKWLRVQASCPTCRAHVPALEAVSPSASTTPVAEVA